MPALTTITIPTPQPYSKNDPTRNQEDFYYVGLQILQAAKDAGESVTLDQASLTQAVEDLMYNGQELSLPLPNGPQLTLKFTHRSCSLQTQ